MTEPLHAVRFPAETDEYRRARQELLASEIALRQKIEAVAAQRRSLPLGGEPPEDYGFEESTGDMDATRTVRLSELFEDCKDTLVLYSFMFIPGEAGLPLEGPCPACTSIIDAVDGQATHLSRLINRLEPTPGVPLRMERQASAQAQRRLGARRADDRRGRSTLARADAEDPRQPNSHAGDGDGASPIQHADVGPDTNGAARGNHGTLIERPGGGRR
jgi:hypothetical protein